MSQGLGSNKWETKRNMTKTQLRPTCNIDVQKPHFCTQRLPLSSNFPKISAKNVVFHLKFFTPSRVPNPNPMLIYNLSLQLYDHYYTQSWSQCICWNLINDRTLWWRERKSVFVTVVLGNCYSGPGPKLQVPRTILE